MTDFADWLADLGLGKYARTLAEQEIDFGVLPRLTEADVRELGLPIGPRRRLLDAIADLRGETGSGANETALQGDAERRQLTVMFVDLAESTRLALRLDPEAMRDLLRTFRDTVAEKIARSGYVAKFMGDGVLAYFGWPKAHEDDAGRAITAALAIADAVDRLDGTAGEKLACRIGIATGIVVVGDIIGEGAAREHAVVGPTPNLAARLQEIAGPGEIIIAEATRRLLRPGFAVELVGERLLKGHDEPVPVSRVLSRQNRASSPIALKPPPLTPIVGRDAELAVLCDAWQDVKSGHPRTVLLSGEPGVGKSRLVQAIAEAATSEGAGIIGFQCSNFHRENPFWPITQRLLSGDVPDHPIDRAARQESPRQETAASMAGHVIEATRGQAALVVCENAQWADRATLEVLRQLVAAKAHLLLIITCRPDEEPRLAAADAVLRIDLRRLDVKAAGALLKAIPGARQLSARIHKEILRRSDGIPAFIEEITKAVLEVGKDGKPVSVPATLRDSLIARLDVSPAIKSVAQIASCIGRDFTEVLLLQVADIPQDRVRDGLDALVSSGLLLPGASGAYRFKQALLRDIAYESLLTSRRQKLHRRIAEAIEAMPGAVAEDEPETLAHHWFGAGQHERAELYWLRAQHRITHWQDQLDALADYLGSDTAAEVIPFPVTSSHRSRRGE